MPRFKIDGWTRYFLESESPKEGPWIVGSDYSSLFLIDSMHEQSPVLEFLKENEISCRFETVRTRAPDPRPAFGSDGEFRLWDEMWIVTVEDEAEAVMVRIALGLDILEEGSAV